MKLKWEYQKISDGLFLFGENENENEEGQTFYEFLENLGNEGWEVFQVDKVNKDSQYHLKRQKG